MMNEKIISKGILQALSWLGLFLILCYFLFSISSILLYISIAAVFSLIGRPLVIFFNQKLKLKNIISVIVTMILLLSFILGIIGLFVPIISIQSENLSLLNIDQLEDTFKKLFNEITTYFSKDQESLKNWVFNQDWYNNLNLSALPDFLNQLINWLSSLTVGFFSVFFITFFFLKENDLVERIVLFFLNSKQKDKISNSFKKIKNLLSRYFIGLLLQITILLIIYTSVLFFFGIKNAFIIAFLCSILNLIPYIGPLIGGFLLIFLTMTSNLDQSFSEVILPKTTYVFIGFIFGQLIDNFFSQPFIFSKSVKSHPLEIFIIILIFGSLLGIIGLVIAIPAYTSIKVIFKEFYSNEELN